MFEKAVQGNRGEKSSDGTFRMNCTSGRHWSNIPNLSLIPSQGRVRVRTSTKEGFVAFPKEKFVPLAINIPLIIKGTNRVSTTNSHHK
jgi:hypothetical protein